MTFLASLPLGFFHLLADGGANAALVTFLIYTLVVFGLAWASNRLLQSKSFLSEYFLGSRGLGVWALALTFAATSASGGSFTGFPAKVYSHGWILALWIASYMVVPICAMGLLGKRINQVARTSGAITIPDVARDRFNSAKFGLLCTVLIVFFMTVNLVAQFKAGSVILQTLVKDVDVFNDAAVVVAEWTADIGFLKGVSAKYLICLFGFGVAVIIYTAYGGFHAVVWTDVMQGIVMVGGVVLMLPLAIFAVGGLDKAGGQMAEMTPPRTGTVGVRLKPTHSGGYDLPADSWLTMRNDEQTAAGAYLENGPGHLLFHVVGTHPIEPTGPEGGRAVKVVQITTPWEIETQFEKLRADLPGYLRQQIDRLEEDRPAGYEQQVAELRARIEQAKISEKFLADPLAINGPLEIIGANLEPYKYGDGEPGHYISGPGPDSASMDGFLPLAIAISFFFMWAISGAGQPSSMVRLMAFKDSITLRRSILTVCLYYSAIYFPLVIIFCCARVLIPGLDSEPDRIMPEMAFFLTDNIGMAWLGGLLVAAPFAAVMSTVDSFLLMISSAVVRDIYQRNINPEASERTIKWMSYGCTLVIGAAAMIGAVNPPHFLQDIIVYCGSGLAACFLGPMVFALYWPRVNVYGAAAGMLGGFLSHLAMYVGGFFVNDSFAKPVTVFGFNPVVIGLGVSFIAVFVVTLLTLPPDASLVRRYFYRRKQS